MLTLKNLKYLFVFPLLTGLISGFVWQADYFFILEMVALVPFFIALYKIRNAAESLTKKILAIFTVTFVYKSTFLFIIAFWLFQISPSILLIYIIVESFFLFAILCIILVKRLHFSVVIALFLLHEFIVQKYLITSPFCLLSYSWGNKIEFIQYYKYLGVEGGSLLLYLLNFVFFSIYIKRKIHTFEKVIFSIFIGLTALSFVTFYAEDSIQLDPTKKASIIHCEINSKDTNYVNNPILLIDSIAAIAAPNSIVLLPEVFINSYGWVESINKNKITKHIEKIAEEKGQAYLTGAYLFSVARNSQITPQSRFLDQYQVYFNAHNTSLLIDNRVRIKSKQNFISFLEYVPNNAFSQWLNNYITDIGDDRKVTPLLRDNLFSYQKKKFNTLLCYETIFPLEVSEKARDQDFLVFQANEDWHHYQQLSHLYFHTNQAMAIQEGIPIYRVSNFGYSGYISAKGETKYLFDTGKSFSLLEVNLPKNRGGTMYHYISGYSYLLAICYLIILLFLRKKKKLI